MVQVLRDVLHHFDITAHAIDARGGELGTLKVFLEENNTATLKPCTWNASKLKRT